MLAYYLQNPKYSEQNELIKEIDALSHKFGGKWNYDALEGRIVDSLCN
jgi:hypothetical protein